MVVVPDSDIILIKSPLKLDNYNQITFNNATSQYNYFIGLPHLEYDGCTYVRKDGVIRYNTDKEDNPNAPRFEDLLGYNYCMYKNDSYKDKWFYAFITDIKYINDGMSEITIETDVFQTWQFDLIYMNSFIEREHVSNDTPGLHTIPEQIEHGEYIEQYLTEGVRGENFYFLNKTYPVVALSDWPLDVAVQSGVKQYNGIYSGFYYVAFKTPSDLDKFISDIQDDIVRDVISAIFMVPASLCDLTDDNFYKPTGHDFYMAFIPFSSSSTEIGSLNITDLGVLDTNYIPRNKKLLCYPYRYILINNNAGSSMDYHYELFNSNIKSFKIFGAISVGCSIKIFPYGYATKNPEVTMNNKKYIYGLDAGKLPTCSWFNDAFTNWLTGNAVNIPIKLISGATKIIGGTFTGSPGTALSGASDILGTTAEIYEHSLSPVTGEGGVNQGDLMFAEKTAFEYHRMTIKREYAEIIDRYFDLYGYRVNRLGNINIHKRLNWDYIKCINVNIEGNVPEKDLDKIRALFNNGCTFWHNTNTFLNYSASNSIL